MLLIETEKNRAADTFIGLKKQVRYLLILVSERNVPMEKKNLFGKCPYVTAQKVLTGKWSMYIMYLLADGPVRFNELQRRMPEKMTHTTLSRQLKTLEEEGLIVRKEYQQIPPKVEYSLSEIGEKFKDVLAVLEVWGNEYIQYLQDKK